MCGRYSLALTDPSQVGAAYPVFESVELRPRYNIAPTDDVPAVTTDRDGHPRGEMLRWGLVPSFASSPSDGARMINARRETVADRPAFRRSLRTMRCLIPAGGFYEWQRRGDGPKQPFHITARDREIFAFAGIWAVWHSSDGSATVRSCSILTTAANSTVAPLHDRMPVILPRDAEATWLAHDVPPEALTELMRGLPAEAMAVRPVSARVNDVRYDGPGCLADPETGELEPVQPSLF